MKDMFDLCPHAALPTPGDARLAKPISKPHLHLPASYIGLNCRFGRFFASKVAGTTTHVSQIGLTSITTQTLQNWNTPINATKTDVLAPTCETCEQMNV